MPMKHVCPLCEEGVAREEVYSTELKIGRKNLLVEGLKKSVCELCGGESVFEDQLKFNDELIHRSIDSDRSVISAGMLRTLRDEWSLTQSDASHIFGAGSNSFAKWESKQTNLSTPSALLIRVALKYPEIVPYLASLCSFTLDEKSYGIKKQHTGSARRRGGYETIHLQAEDASNVVFLHTPTAARSFTRQEEKTPWLRPNAWEKARA